MRVWKHQGAAQVAMLCRSSYFSAGATNVRWYHSTSLGAGEDAAADGDEEGSETGREEPGR